MKKLVCLILAVALVLSAAAAMADPIRIDGNEKRDIQINDAGLNPSAEEMRSQGISPTTGRSLQEIRDSIPADANYDGFAISGIYRPVMVQISNAGNGIGYNDNRKQYYTTAPMNVIYADVVYEACQKRGGGLTRMSYIFSDVIPDYVGFVRSTRPTHPRIRQEWDAIFCTSGYAPHGGVPEEWRSFGVPNPEGRTNDDPGIIYTNSNVGDNKPWKKYVYRLKGITDANSELFELANLINDVVPKDYQFPNHTFKFTDEVPEGGDSGSFVTVKFGNRYETDSRLEYNADQNAYIRYVEVQNVGDQPYCSVPLVNPEKVQVKDENGTKVTKLSDTRDFGSKTPVTFNNVIVQSIQMDWKGLEKPYPTLTGTGNADYFMGGKHYKGVWKRDDYNSRTVFYGEDGNEISLQRGRTLIILMDYNDENCLVEYE